MGENTVLYTVGLFGSHAFRVYPNGYITRANQQEKEIAKKIIDCK